MFSLAVVNAKLSKIHYIPPITATDDPGDQWLYISTPSTSPVNFEVKVGGMVGATSDSGTVFFSGNY